jgi:hypothetical protein
MDNIYHIRLDLLSRPIDKHFENLDPFRIFFCNFLILFFSYLKVILDLLSRPIDKLFDPQNGCECYIERLFLIKIILFSPCISFQFYLESLENFRVRLVRCVRCVRRVGLDLLSRPIDKHFKPFENLEPFANFEPFENFLYNFKSLSYLKVHIYKHLDLYYTNYMYNITYLMCNIFMYNLYLYNLETVYLDLEVYETVDLDLDFEVYEVYEMKFE